MAAVVVAAMMVMMMMMMMESDLGRRALRGVDAVRGDAGSFFDLRMERITPGDEAFLVSAGMPRP